MNYDLAKKLKAAGFPQDKTEYFYRKYSLRDEPFKWERPMGGMEISALSGEVEWECAAPTLSELIAACGDNFTGLTRYEDKKGIFWKAWGYKKGVIEIFEDSTPEEAVAHLWLALNKK